MTKVFKFICSFTRVYRQNISLFTSLLRIYSSVCFDIIITNKPNPSLYECIYCSLSYVAIKIIETHTVSNVVFSYLSPVWQLIYQTLVNYISQKFEYRFTKTWVYRYKRYDNNRSIRPMLNLKTFRIHNIVRTS